MEFTIMFAVALLIFLVGISFSIAVSMKKMKIGKVMSPFHIITVVVFISSLCLFIPIYSAHFQLGDGVLEAIKTFLISVHNVLRLFVVDADFDFVVDIVSNARTPVENFFLTFMAVLFVLAPILTFGFILTFFKNLSAYLKYFLSLSKLVYVFSELNERSICLAKDLKKNHKNAIIVFTDVYDENEEGTAELIGEAAHIDAITFKKDISDINFSPFGNKRREIYFFLMGENEEEIIKQSLDIIEKYKQREKTHLYVFSSHVASSLLLSSDEERVLKIRRVDETLALVNRQLYDDGYKIFESAKTVPDMKEKHIGAVIVGTGGFGTEMIKSLVWFCQMDGYRIEIDAFDKDPAADEKFAAKCPEIMDRRYNGVYIPGESRFRVSVHGGFDVDTISFSKEIKKLVNATFVFVSLGSDELNIQTAINLRTLFEQIGAKPIIKAIVRNSAMKETLINVKNFRGQSYDIDLIGDSETSYTEAVIIDSELEMDALARHKKWGDEQDFWKFEYNYRSSIASAIHMKARIYCGIPGADKREGDLTEEERDIIEKLEHRRWNAYMRSIGYIYSGSPDKSSRNDLGKMHHNLVEFNDLSEADKRKDSSVGSK